MISVFDTNPVVFEDTDRTLTISYNGVLCKDANGQVITDIDFDDVNELYLTRYLNSNCNYTIMFRDHNWKNMEGQDLDTDRKDYNTGHNIRETKAIIAAFARLKKIFDSPDMKITLNAITLPLLEAIVTRNTGHGIDFTRGNGFDQKDSNYIIIRYLDSGFFLEKDGTAPTEWQKNAADRTAAFKYDVKTLLV